MPSLLWFAFACVALQAQPVLDGKIEDAEWSKATTHRMLNGGTIQVLPEGDVVYFAVKMPTFGWGHLCVYDGETVQVLHVSAALARLRYKLKGGEWSTDDRWASQIRDRSYSEALRAAQEKYFAENGWVGTNNGMDRGGFEIKLRRTPGKTLRIAAAFVSEPDKLYAWPDGANDDSRHRPLINGWPPPSLKFDPAQWFELK